VAENPNSLTKFRGKFPALNLKNICSGIQIVDIIRSQIEGWTGKTYIQCIPSFCRECIKT
jgi:hypothetical protein